MPPKRIKEGEKDDEGQIRVNPFLVSLDEMPPEAILDGKPGAVWHFSASLREDAANPGVLKWDIMVGSENPLTVMRRMDFLKVLGGMRKAANQQQRKAPERRVEYPTPEDFKKSIDGLGHPTIAVAFKIHGTTKEGRAAMSGEFRYDRTLNSGAVNDKSGRYMSEKARPKKTDRDPEKVAEWGKMIAKMFAERLQVPVIFEQLKTADNPVGSHASTLQPPAARPASTAAQGGRHPRAVAPTARSKRKRR
ncbi:hypothetical protein [Streptomyces sp. NPDC004250]|uniref:hypothetical protein n=1 Tax=Streptomyces sp. NPDC004250 TaxID=3364692 RepID=UPI0036A085EB